MDGRVLPLVTAIVSGVDPDFFPVVLVSRRKNFNMLLCELERCEMKTFVVRSCENGQTSFGELFAR